MSKSNILFIILLLVSGSLSSQITNNDIIVGKEFSIISEALGDTIYLKVGLPKSYNESQKDYPVLYLLDGQISFLHGLSTLQSLTRYNHRPEFIVVGITTEGKKRNQWIFGQPEEFMNAIEEDVVPLVERKHRCGKERIIFGWEATGGFILNEVLTHRPELFGAFLVSSPGPVYGDYFRGLKHNMDQLEQTLISGKLDGKFLLFTKAKHDFPVNYGMEKLLNLFVQKAPANVNWNYKELNEEIHLTTLLPTINHGIEMFFDNYGGLKIADIQELNKRRAELISKEYDLRRQQRFGLSEEEIEKSSKIMRRSNVLDAIARDDFVVFEELIELYGANEFLEEQHYPHAFWYGQFYLKHNKPEKALSLYQFLLKKFGDKAQTFNGLGDISRFNNDFKEAKRYYTKAVQLGKKNNDWRLTEYEEDLKAMIE